MRRGLVLALWCGVSLLTLRGQAQEKPYVIGLEPTLTESISLPEGRILARYLTNALNHPVESRAFTSYDELIDAVAKNKVDFAWINPYAFVKASQQGNVTPLVKALRQGGSYRAVFFVRADSKVKSLADLKGLKVAWVDRTSTAGYLFPQAMLLKQHLDPATLFHDQLFTGSHGEVCKAVLSGKAEVGATFHTGNEADDYRPDGCIVSLSSRVAAQVRGIASSDPIPNEVIAAAPATDEGVAGKVRDAFLQMSASAAGRQVLKAVFHADGFELAHDGDFDAVREATRAVPGEPVAVVADQQEQKPYLLGLEPTLAKALSLPEGRILAKYLTKELHHPVESRAFDTYDGLIDAIAKGEVDFAWINPYAFVQASKKGSITPLAKALRNGGSYRAVFFVRADSKAHSLADLKGLKAAWVEKTSTAGYLFPQAMLLKQYIDPATYFRSQIFAGSHGEVCKAVISGAADVGATFHTGNDPGDFRPDGCIVSLSSRVADQVRGIASSDPIPNEVIAASPNTDPEAAHKMASAFVNMSDSAAGRQILKAVFHADGFSVAHDGDFAPVREAIQILEHPPVAEAQAAPAPSASEPTSRSSDATIIHFANNDSVLTADATGTLDRLVSAMKSDRKLLAHIAGFTDSVYDPQFNINLSWRRATAVRNYLIKAGIPPVRLAAKGLGMKRPIATNDTEEGRAANRRVEISTFYPKPVGRGPTKTQSNKKSDPK